MTVVEEGAIIAGRYRLERKLARGGMGSVWLARHLQLDSGVAIKLIAPEYASSLDARARFEREAKAAAQLRTPNVVHVYDYGVEDDTPFIAMELLEGEDLDARLRREGRLTRGAVLVIVNQLCKALRLAHDAGLVHRDLKPANIFLARQGQDEIVKVLDFGIAKATGLGPSGGATKTGTLLGSPYYMSPEQVRRRKGVDHRSDLWSVGVIIFQCLTGRLPFQAEELGELILEICAEAVPLASQFAPDLDLDVNRFLARALAREPHERFQSASELADAFSALVSAGAADARQDAFTPAPRGASAPFTQPFPAAPANAGTLAPSGTSVVAPPTRGRGNGVPRALVATTLLLGVIAYAAVHTLAVGVARAPRLDQDTASPSATPTPAAPPAADVPSAIATAAASASASPSASADASAPPPRKPRSAPPGKALQPTRTKLPHDDLTNRP
jgi:serine/threonine-protein kinase